VVQWVWEWCQIIRTLWESKEHRFSAHKEWKPEIVWMSFQCIRMCWLFIQVSGNARIPVREPESWTSYVISLSNRWILVLIGNFEHLGVNGLLQREKLVTEKSFDLRELPRKYQKLTSIIAMYGRCQVGNVTLECEQ